MQTVIQLVTHANVVVGDMTIATIKKGMLALIGIEKTDTNATAEKLLLRILNYRVFKDEQGKTNLSLQDIQGGLLLVPQFTLVADTQKGLRPGFSRGMPPEEGRQLFAYLVDHAKQLYAHIETGTFGADMQVTLCNNGPMTFLLAS